jgi:hypothetical protein
MHADTAIMTIVKNVYRYLRFATISNSALLKVTAIWSNHLNRKLLQGVSRVDMCMCTDINPPSGQGCKSPPAKFSFDVHHAEARNWFVVF